MTSYTVAGIFFNNGATLSGTINITGGAITSMDLTVSGFAGHFTEIYFNEPFSNSWELSAQTPGSCDTRGCEEDYLVVNFVGSPAVFTQAKFTYGAAVHNSYGTPTLTTYYGYGLQGTICPLEGCAPWPLPPPLGVPSGIAGAGLGLALLLTLAVRRFL